jgi:hypothetical protein
MISPKLDDLFVLMRDEYPNLKVSSSFWILSMYFIVFQRRGRGGESHLTYNRLAAESNLAGPTNIKNPFRGISLV